MFEASGVDALNITAACYASMPAFFDTQDKEEGWQSYLAEKIKKVVVKVPVFTVGSIRSPEVAERILEDGKADFIGLGRTLVADPHWTNKAKEGRLDDIIKCVSCNQGCLGRLLKGIYLGCTVNPVTGREGRWAQVAPAEKSKTVIIVGGGPAGMEGARIAARRGHDVTLYEKEKELGGQAALAASGPGKGKWRWFNEYLAVQIAKEGVKVKLGQEATGASIAAAKPDVVIVATGAVQAAPDLPGVGGPNVTHAWDILSGKVRLAGEKVIVAGGGIVGCETAEFLTKDNDVTLVEMLPAIASGMEIVHMVAFFGRLPSLKIAVITGAAIKEFNAEGLVYVNGDGIRKTVEGTKIVLALGVKPVRELARELQGKVPELYLIGDGNRPAKITEAVYDGSRIGRLI